MYLHEFECGLDESLQTSSLISYATMVYLEPGFKPIHTVIDLIRRSSLSLGPPLLRPHQGTCDTVSA